MKKRVDSLFTIAARPALSWTLGAVVVCAAGASTTGPHEGTTQGFSECAGTASIGSCNDPAPENLDCLGYCPTDSSCAPASFTSGGTTYWSCACVGAGEGGPTEPSCCHLVVVTPSSGPPYWGARGGCASCGTTGACQVVPGGCQAECR